LRSRVASGSKDKTIRLWNVATQTAFTTLTQNSEVDWLAFSPDGETLASNSDFGVTLLDIATKADTWSSLNTPGAGAWSLAFSPDGKTLASGSIFNQILLWDIASHANIATLKPGDRAVVNCVAFSPDGKMLASGGADNTARLWSVATHANIAAFAGNTSEALVHSVAFSPDGKTLASGSGDHTVRLWDVATHHNIATLGHSSPVHSVAFSPDGKILASGSSTARLWIGS
jgi:WD40 repeat protein